MCHALQSDLCIFSLNPRDKAPLFSSFCRQIEDKESIKGKKLGLFASVASYFHVPVMFEWEKDSLRNPDAVSTKGECEHRIGFFTSS